MEIGAEIWKKFKNRTLFFLTMLKCKNGEGNKQHLPLSLRCNHTDKAKVLIDSVTKDIQVSHIFKEDNLLVASMPRSVRYIGENIKSQYIGTSEIIKNLSISTSSKSSKMRYLKAVKLQHTKWKNWHTERTPYEKRRTEKVANGPSLINLLKTLSTLICFFHCSTFLYSSTLWDDIASAIGYHRSDLRLDLTPQMTDLFSKRSIGRFGTFGHFGTFCTVGHFGTFANFCTFTHFGHFVTFGAFDHSLPFWHYLPFWHFCKFLHFYPFWLFWPFLNLLHFWHFWHFGPF